LLSRVKGRDWYSLIWFLQPETPSQLAHHEARRRQLENWTKAEPLERASFRRVYEETLAQTDSSCAA
jgi:hypothetical protein